MVAVSWWLNRRFFPTPYDFKRIAEYVVLGVALFFVSEGFIRVAEPSVVVLLGVNAMLFATFVAYAVWREKIDLKGLIRSILKKTIKTR